RHRRPVREDPYLQLPAEPRHRSSHWLHVAQSAGDPRWRGGTAHRGAAHGGSGGAHVSDSAPPRREATVLSDSVGALVDELAALLGARDRFVGHDAIAEAREIVAALY